MLSLALALLTATTDPVASLKQEGPVDFVCDKMQLFRQPDRAVCTQNVVVRRGDLILCCDRFEGYMNPDGSWQRLICRDHVRAQRNDEVMWAQQATYILAISQLILEGEPKVQRGLSMLRGERIVVNTDRDQAHIEQPRGRVEKADLPPPHWQQAFTRALQGELPRQCPVPPSPAR